MKKIIMVLILLFVPLNAHAIDGEVYFGNLFDSTLRGHPDGGTADYISGLELGHYLFKDRVRPYTKIDFRMDGYGEGFFHPSSVNIEIGVRLDIYEWLYLEGVTSCWHGIDGTYINKEAYRMLKIGITFGKRH